MKIKSRHQIRKSQAREILELIGQMFPDVGSHLKRSKLEQVIADDHELLLVDGEPLFYFSDGEPFFTVRGALKLQPEQRLVVVDAGAVSFVVKGADIMRPGIVSADAQIKEGDKVIIVEETHGKPLAIGRAMVPGEQMRGNSGKVIKNMHYVGDGLWNFQP